MNHKFSKTFAGAFFVLALTTTSRSVSVENNWNVTVNQAQEIIKESTESVQKIKVNQMNENVRNTFNNMYKKTLIKIFKGEVTEISGETLKVKREDISYKVTVTDMTIFLRRFWGNSTISEVKVGDTVNITGRWTNEAENELEAIVVRDLSNQKRYGVFFGEVVSMGTLSIEIKTIRRGNVLINISDSTKLVNREMKTITLGDIKTGDRVRVKGLLNENSTITDVVQIKDFSQPTFAVPSPLQ